MKTLICIATCSLITLHSIAEPAPQASKEFDSFQLISGFHSHFDKASGFEFRIIEVDGSATVAMNPIYLYLVATNNSSGEALQSRIVELPEVSSIKRIHFLDQANTIRIDALFDRSNEDGSKHWTVAGTITIFIPIKDGKLPMLIDTTVKIRNAEQGGADQPATAPELKSEGKDKPQPESKVRPQ